ncbi:hypothetical protein BV210_08795 [Halorientalis sp. IM1011]|uniref:hypothetical protein n=1 Tax=Halorientalis sp. IM1011 TaxID=1932360 RepID=UPI00097CD5C7|nr:hypothetical protein [Halorientalis sp. IM1011]AQL42801.1 hypothetical protein BV210_08795 [Halorientalis sp. IM1011]
MHKRDALGVLVAATGLLFVGAGPTLPVAVALFVAGAYLLAAPRFSGAGRRVDRSGGRRGRT